MSLGDRSQHARSQDQALSTGGSGGAGRTGVSQKKRRAGCSDCAHIQKHISFRVSKRQSGTHARLASVPQLRGRTQRLYKAMMSGYSLLLDTHVVIWMATEPDRLPGALVRAIETVETRFVSHVSAWIGRGKSDL